MLHLSFFLSLFLRHNRSSDDHSPSGFDRNNYYERGSSNSNVVRSSVIGGVGGVGSGGGGSGCSIGPTLAISGGVGSGSDQDTATAYIRRPNNYHGGGAGGGSELKTRTRERLYRNGPYSSSIVDR